MAIKYQPGGVTVAIGRSQDISIPTRVFRGRATCMHFDTDKSFLLPPSMPGVRNIVQFYARHSGMTMLVNGHTDLVGDAQYNLQLSLERASAVSSYLQNKVDDWLIWYQAPVRSKRWSYIEDQNMLATLTDSTGAPYYAGAVNGVNDAATQAATRRFQSDNGLMADGQLGPDTRRALVGKYMALDGTSLPLDATLKIHGCGKFHPIDSTREADQGNRRVEIFLFDGPIDPAPVDPCPSPGCTQYPQWVGNPLEDIDLCQPQDFELTWVSLRFEGNGIVLQQIIRAADRELQRVIQPSADGTDQSGDNRFEVALEDLKDDELHSTHVSTTVGVVSTRVIFHPARLQAALASGDPAAISAAIDVVGWD
jgi:outer membrane protein OmpA-like peptidoglycan-associated protein